jgi:5-hydroxyisourate hydrolase
VITTHVLDTALGRPAAGVPVTLELAADEGWRTIGAGATDADGRLRTLTPSGAVTPGRYRIRFDTSACSVFFPIVEIQFVVADGNAHYHVPLLLSPYGYSTYRGS